MMQKTFDTLADWLAIDGLQRNTRPVRPTSFLSLGLLFLPGVFFLVALSLLKDISPRFAWFNDLSAFPWQFWGIGICGVVATLGGAGDWVFHKIYVTVGPKEHHSHILALGAGGLVFVMMAFASLSEQPVVWLIPVMIALLLTVTLICYDEFAFHVRRCKPFETMLHRMLVFGNGLAFLCWFHWIFVEWALHAGV
jgi:hypothetical protein